LICFLKSITVVSLFFLSSIFLLSFSVCKVDIILVKNLKQNKSYTEILQICAKRLSSSKIICHNARFDLQFLLAEKIDVCDNLVADTRMMQFLTNPLGANGLGFLIQLYFDFLLIVLLLLLMLDLNGHLFLHLCIVLRDCRTTAGDLFYL
jgi:hypothetical protein